MRQLNISIDDKVHSNLSTMARDASMPVSTYAKVLFEAAYAARWNSSGDLTLDAKVGAAVVLFFGAKKDSATIAKALGVSEPLVEKIVSAWRREVLAA